MGGAKEWADFKVLHDKRCVAGSKFDVSWGDLVDCMNMPVNTKEIEAGAIPVGGEEKPNACMPERDLVVMLRCEGGKLDEVQGEEAHEGHVRRLHRQGAEGLESLPGFSYRSTTDDGGFNRCHQSCPAWTLRSRGARAQNNTLSQ